MDRGPNPTTIIQPIISKKMYPPSPQDPKNEFKFVVLILQDLQHKQTKGAEASFEHPHSLPGRVPLCSTPISFFLALWPNRKVCTSLSNALAFLLLIDPMPGPHAKESCRPSLKELSSKVVWNTPRKLLLVPLLLGFAQMA